MNQTTILRRTAFIIGLAACHAHAQDAMPLVDVLPPPVRLTDVQPVLVPETASATALAPPDIDQDVGEDDILDMDLDQLTKVEVVVPSFDVQVTSVTRNESTVGKSAASVFVITNDMIRRSGVTNVAEALRMAPGMMVSRIDSNRWAISSRGFSGEFANKLLVLIDGRSVYTPVFSGVHWSFQDTPLADIDRIEVIRGPGASVWGSNAINGVINIITKDASQTQGGLIASGGGSEIQSNNHFRYGGQLASGANYRLYGTHQERDAGYRPSPTAQDDGRISRIGIRSDWNPHRSTTEHLTFVGELFQGNSGANLSAVPIPTPPFSAEFARDEPFSGGFAMLNWTEQLAPGASRTVRTYYDHQTIDAAFSKLELDIFDIDWQRTSLVADQHHLTYGLGYRLMADRFTNVIAASTFSPTSRETHLFSSYVQDQYDIVPDDLIVTAGVRVEHNSYTGFEFQPTIRLLKLFDPRNAAWMALSRAVRIPSRAEDDVQLTIISPEIPLPVQVVGNQQIQAEDLVAFEAGYRTQPTDNFSWDVSLFMNEYYNIIAFDTLRGPDGFPPLLSTTFLNAVDASTHGIEVNGTYQIDEQWKLAGWYSCLQWDIRDMPANAPPPNALGFTNHQARLTSSWTFHRNVDVDLMLRFVDRIVDFEVPSYLDCSLRLAWRPRQNLEMSIVGNNLFDSHRFEYNTNRSYYLSTERQREVYGQLTWRF